MLVSALLAAAHVFANVGSNQGSELTVNNLEDPTATEDFSDPSTMSAIAMPTGVVVEPFPAFPAAAATTLNSAATNLPGSGLLVGGMLLAIL